MLEANGATAIPSACTECADDLPAPPMLATTRLCARGEVIPSAIVTGEAHGVLDRGILLLDLSANGRSFALDFVFSGQAVRPLIGLDERLAARIGFTAIEECSLLIWPRGVIEALGGAGGWAKLQRRLADRATARSSQRFVSLLTRSAVERYHDMHDEFPADWQRLPQHLIASYLGITPQYLCQLKREAIAREKVAQPETS